MTTQFDDTPYEQDYGAEPKRGMSGWLIALIVVAVLIVLCCICALALVVIAGPAVGDVFSTIIETIEVMTPVP